MLRHCRCETRRQKPESTGRIGPECRRTSSFLSLSRVPVVSEVTTRPSLDSVLDQSRGFLGVVVRARPVVLLLPPAQRPPPSAGRPQVVLYARLNKCLGDDHEQITPHDFLGRATSSGTGRSRLKTPLRFAWTHRFVPV
jgi:hypothetical protein